jgi:predicted enzyme related to lactoylglutathione lyase
MTMSDGGTPAGGTIGWVDLTVDDAPGVRDFYRQVTGWKASELSMGDYADYVMESPATGAGVAGICHARGGNAGLPAQWLIYIVVDDVEASAARAAELGGEVIAGPKQMGDGASYCVIRDPAGAVAALYAPAGGA